MLAFPFACSPPSFLFRHQPQGRARLLAAAEAGVRQLALYHLVPAPPEGIGERVFRRGLSDDTILVRDLHTFDLPADSTEIRILEP